jgi:hypothetical protein
MAEYIAKGVSTVPPRHGVDGGMNPVFLAKLSTPNEFDNNGRTYQVAGMAAPGALPRTPNPPGALPRTPPAATAASAEAPVRPVQPPASEPVVVANIPVPRPAPLPKEGDATAQENPTTIAGLIGNLFGGSKAQASPSTSAPQKKQAASGATNTELAAKPKRPAPAAAPAPVRTASAPAHSAAAPAPVHTASTPVAPAPKPREATPKAVAQNSGTPAPNRDVQQTAKNEAPRARQPEIRTAYSTPPASTNGLLAGAQPVVPAGSFNSFR